MRIGITVGFEKKLSVSMGFILVTTVTIKKERETKDTSPVLPSDLNLTKHILVGRSGYTNSLDSGS